ncbi:VOC family protein [Tumebacillus sp. DT12]|uniref:VOC family protein n=1 Tax=Tumebacillus lacus TaxID=2995335 RepID=A0ABT3X3A5_9BACL|nr:VOC family protein [Tumebacillus lacus]MCX7569209.1 VOC family protein [Tumebacillus lacus]
MKIKLTSIFVNDQEKARTFYTEVLGFVVKQDMPAGNYKWLTVVSPEGPDDLELLLEPNINPAAQAYQESLYTQGIPTTSFFVDDVQAEYDRMSKLGVVFPTLPSETEWGVLAVFDDTCGNLISIHQG